MANVGCFCQPVMADFAGKVWRLPNYSAVLPPHDCAGFVKKKKMIFLKLFVKNGRKTGGRFSKSVHHFWTVL